MKKLFSLLLCAVMALSLGACGSKTDDNQTNDEPESTAPELSGTMKVVATGDVYGPLFDAFTADTGVEVECLSMSPGEVLSKLRAEGGTPSADLWFRGGSDAFMSAKDDGLLEPVTFDAAAELGDGGVIPAGVEGIGAAAGKVAIVPGGILAIARRDAAQCADLRDELV